MVTASQNVRAVVVTEEQLFLQLVSSELRAMGFEEIVSVESCSIVTDAPQVLITNVESEEELHLPETEIVYISYDRPTGTPTDVGGWRCLRRPFLLRDFQRVVRDALSEIARREDEKAKRRHVFRGSARPRRRIGGVGLRLSRDRKAVLIAGKRVDFTPGEALVFGALYEADGEVVTRDALRERLSADRTSNLPDVHICAIRKKLTEAGSAVLPETLRGKGYRLRR